MCLLPVAAQATSESRAAVLFLLIAPGACSHGRGGTGTALANGGTAAYFNPAGLANHELIAGEFSSHKWLPWLADDLRYTYAAVAFKSKRIGDAVGLSFSRLDRGEQTQTNERGDVEGTFSAYDQALALTYAHSMGNMSVGISAKYIYSHLSEEGAGLEKGEGQGKSIAIDIGMLRQGLLGGVLSEMYSEKLGFLYVSRIAQYRRYMSNRLSPGFSVGIAISNIGSDMVYVDASQADPLPTNLRLGIAGNLIDTDLIGFQVAADLYKPLINEDAWSKRLFTAWIDEDLGDEFEEMDVHLGAEVTALYLITLRGGRSWDWDGDYERWTWGFSIGPETVRLSYARIEDDTRYSLSLNL